MRAETEVYAVMEYDDFTGCHALIAVYRDLDEAKKAAEDEWDAQHDQDDTTRLRDGDCRWAHIIEGGHEVWVTWVETTYLRY